jgi:hypothetical protein
MDLVILSFLIYDYFCDNRFTSFAVSPMNVNAKLRRSITIWNEATLTNVEKYGIQLCPDYVTIIIN